MKLGLFLYEYFQKHKDRFRGVLFHDSFDQLFYQPGFHGQIFVYDANAKLVQELIATVGYGMSGWFGDFYYLEAEDTLTNTPPDEPLVFITPPVTPPFFVTNLPNVRLVYRGPVAVDSLGRKFQRQYSNAVWLGVTGHGWFGALRMKRRGWIFRRDHWELYAYTAEGEANPQLPGSVFQPGGIEGPDAVFLSVTELLVN